MNSVVFNGMPLGLPFKKRGFKNDIELKEWNKHIITTKYNNPKRYKEEIEKTKKINIQWDS